MKPLPLPSTDRARSQRAFSLMELLLAVSIMTVIIGALYAIFNQTQRALRASVTQVDVQEGGRAAMDMFVREMAQMTPCNVAGGTNLVWFLSPVYWGLPNMPVKQGLYGGGVRTNALHEVYFLSCYNRDFTETGYRVLYASNGVGTLARFTVTTNFYNRRPGSNEFAALGRFVMLQQPTNYVTIADGVIHFRLQAYDAYGWPMTWDMTNRYANRWLYPDVWPNLNVSLFRDLRPEESMAAFMSNALPAFVELELGLLEPQTYEKYRAFAQGSPMAARFLSNHAAQVHLFRQRIPIRESLFLQAQHP